MYGIITCRQCRRPRIIDMGTKETVCPYCGNREVTDDKYVAYHDEDQKRVREAFGKLTGFSGSIEKKRADPETDPYSSLVYEYEHCSSLDEKMDTLAHGLTKLYGTFTLEDVEKFEPKNAEKMLKAMLVNCVVYETKYGHYKA